MEGKGRQAGAAFLEERQHQIDDLLTELGQAKPLEPRPYEREWNQLRGLLRDYSDEIERSGVGRRAMRRRVLVLLDKQWRLERDEALPPIERFEMIGLLHVFAAEAIASGRDTDQDMKAFMGEWDVHHRGILVKVTAMSAWMLARDDSPGHPE